MRLAALTGLILAIGALAGCAGASPPPTPTSSFGRYYRGRTLDISVVTIERVPELRYSTMGPAQSHSGTIS